MQWCWQYRGTSKHASNQNVGRCLLFEQLMQRYSQGLDTSMRQIVGIVPDDIQDMAVMIRYPLGWVDEHNQPYAGTTGKRIRPIFLLLCNEAAGGDWHQALYAATAVELLHNFSLIHDDIQDNSSVRHNRPTVWKIWGRANAINAGDILFSLSFAALHKLTDTGIEPTNLLKLWDIFNRTNLELTRGQHLDMQFENRDSVSVDEYVSMISGKSAALLAACAQMGAQIATTDDAMSSRYAEFALNMGIAFQIRDDILGIWGDPDIIGKSTATDIVSRKKSLPVLYGLSKNSDLKSIYQQESLSADDVEKAVALLETCGARDYAHTIEADYYNKAVESLGQANPKGRAAEELRQFVGALFQRAF